MINSNINKVKACKSLKDQPVGEPDRDRKNKPDKGEGDKEGGKRGPVPVQPLQLAVAASRDSRTKDIKEQKAPRAAAPLAPGRTRARDDFRMARGGSGSVDKRGAYRGRGVYTRKADRDGDSYGPRVIKSHPDSTAGIYKHHADSRNKTDFGSLVPEDSRISKVLRRLFREEDSEKFVALTLQLQDALGVPENMQYIKRCFENILDALLDLLYNGPGISAKSQIAKAMGHVGYVLDSEFKRFIDWIFPKYTSEKNTEVKCFLMEALRQTLTLDAETLKLKPHSVTLMMKMQQILENTDLPDLFVTCIEVIMQLSALYPDTLTDYFRDLVDILVGWLIDSSQSAKMTDYAAKSLQRLAPYWIQELNFSITFLGQFLEDMEIYGDDFVKSLSPQKDELLSDAKTSSPDDFLFKVEAFIKSFNTVIKALGDNMSPANSTHVTWTFLGDCLSKVLVTVKSVLDVRFNEDLIMSVNECVWLLLSHLQTKTTPGHDLLYEMFDYLLGQIDNMCNVTICSVLHVIAKAVREVSANLPLELVQKLLSPSSSVVKLRFSPSKSIQKAALELYHALLNLKNIPLLQEAYKYVLGDLEVAYRHVVPELELLCQTNPFADAKYSPSEAEVVILFLLAALSDLANASNSIIGMWALKPSMFELLALRMKPREVKTHTGLHYTILYLLFSHCSKSNNFVSSSSLVQVGSGTRRPLVLSGVPSLNNSDSSVSSPTSANLSNILQLLKESLLDNCSLEVDLLLLTWVREILTQGAPYLPTMAETVDFQSVLSAVVSKGHSALKKPPISLAVCGTLQVVFQFQNISWRSNFLTSVTELCLLHINCTYADVATGYSQLLSVLPWNITLPVLAHMNFEVHSQNPKGCVPQKIRWSYSSQLSKNEVGLMGQQEFRQFMWYLIHGEEGERSWLLDLFSQSWPLSLCSNVNSDNETSADSCKSNTPKDLSAIAKYCQPVLLQWAVWDSAQFCVTSKLRTPLGKPQETFTKIESAIKSLAREADDFEAWDVMRVRVLVDFLEQLEKVIYNAGEGTALAIELPPKQVRTFFHTNRSTCVEWLTRIRLAVVAVALRAGQAATAVRQGHALLQYLHEMNNTQGLEFERAALYVGCALTRLHEWESVQGLYIWARNECGRKIPLLKGLVEQAAGRLEHAVDFYSQILSQSSEDHHAGGDCDLRMSEVADDQLTECHRALQDWAKLAKWKLDEKNSYPTNGGMLLLSTLKTNHIEGFAEYEAGSYEAAARLMEWDTEAASNLTTQPRTWNTLKMLRSAHSNLSSIAVALAGESFVPISEDIKLKWSQYVDQCQNDAHLLLKEGLRNTTSELLLEAAVTQYAASGLADLLHAQNSDSGPLLLPLSAQDTNLKNLNSGILSNALWWSEFLEHMGIQNQTTSISELRVTTAHTARKEKNLGFALRLLSRELGAPAKSSLQEVAKVQINTPHLSSPLELRALTEVAKVLYAADKKDYAVSVVVHGAQRIRNSEDAILQERGSRLLLTLAKWIHADPSLAVCGDNKSAISHLLEQDIAGGADLLDIQNCSLLTQNGVQIIPTTDTTIGRVLRLAVVQCPQLAKSWAHFANWCYRWGRRAVDVTNEIGGQLSAADKACVQAMMPQDASPSDLESVFSILGQTRAVADEEDIDLDSTNTSEMMESQLRTVNVLHYANPETLAGLVGVWREAQQRVYSCYQLSAVAYFKFLQLCGQEEACTEDCSTVTASLRLLRLVVKHALELQSVLEAGLAATPTAPWKAIIPQLFSRMGHPEPYVRRRVAELLCRLAEDAPHLITFPAVVGAASGGARLRHMPMPGTARLFGTYLTPEGEEVESLGEEEEDDEDDDDDEEEDEEENDGSGQMVLKNCFLAMVDTLSKQAPEAISQVQQFVCELRRITLLWDELWLGTLSQNQSEINQKVSQLKAEITRVEQNGSLSPTDKEKLISEKYRIIVKPLVFIFEQLHAITSVTPETPHERWFQEKHGKLIEVILHAMKEPKDFKRAEEWHTPLKSLQSRLNVRNNKRAAHTLRMEDISPTLASLKDSCIAMPGVRSGKGRIITIASVHNLIYILPTKTKPKKLMFHGSDGKTYYYLFKGLEDLHLDERIMQLLNIANMMLRTPWLENSYRARHYSVIPLGPRSGLISWVENVTPLFGLYKRWQQRQASALAAKNGVTPVQVKRPSELFYQKLSPKLKEKGVALEHRKEWPLPVLREVLQELMAETPSQLLAKELWCHSVNAGAWYKTLQTYSHSVAVMSVIGYIIGLGDRHLDNVLVDLTTGEVVHIDYNVCFEKGKTLRVPEKVPFRMTPNIQAALGVTGVEGIFRMACEHVLRVMKKGRETLLTLLEAFVYDPLIDWTTGNEAGYAGAVYGGGQAITLESKQSHKELEREVTRTMFSIRVVEMRADWLQNRDEVIASLVDMMTLIGGWTQSWTEMQGTQDQLQDCHSLLALVKEAEVQIPNRTHSLYTLALRYAGHKRAKDAQEAARSCLRDKQAKCDQQLQQYNSALSCIHSPQFSSLSAPVNKEEYMVFDLVKEFLQNAGQSQMVYQCEQWEAEMEGLALKQMQIMRGCIDLLNQYGAICGLFPTSYINKHRIVSYQRWIGLLLADLSISRCQEVVAEFGAILPPTVNGRTPLRQQVVNFAFGLQTALAEANIRLQKSYGLLRGENGIDVGARLENACAEADSALNKLRMGDSSVNVVIECVVVTALVSLNKRFLMMEAASASAGDCLVDLTSREGEWFLDDMCLISGMMTRISSLIQGPTSDALQCLSPIHKLFCALQDLNSNFASIILPEAVVALQTENPSVLAMIQKLSAIIKTAPMSLQDLVDRLDIHLSCIAIGVDSPHNDVHHMVTELRNKFELLLHESTVGSSDISDGTMCAGQMLLMGFNGLFEKLYLDSHGLAPKLSSINANIPVCWRNLDHIREAKAFSGKMMDDRTRPVLEDIFLLKRLQTMDEFFWMCSAVGRCYRGDMPEPGDPPPPILVDEENLLKPVRRFSADFVSRMLFGVVTHTMAVGVCKLLQSMGLNVTGEIEQRDIGAESKVSLEELSRKAVDRNCGLRSAVLAQVSAHVSALESCWRRRESHKTLTNLISQQTATVQRLQLAVTTHYWLHDVVLQSVPGIPPPPPFNRSVFMCDLQRSHDALIVLQSQIKEVHERQQSLVTTVEQRLKWAAGANPAVNEVLSAFACAVEALEERIQREQGMASVMTSTCGSILHHEFIRSNCPAGMQMDTIFLQLVDQCEKSCHISCETGEVLSPAEESLLQMVSLEGQVDKAWIQKAEVAISDKIKMLQQKMASAQEMVFSGQESIKSQVSVLRTHLSSHNRLMGDVRSLIKSMAKFEDGAFVGLGDYMVRYRAYSDQLISLTRQLTSADSLVHTHVGTILSQVQLLIDNTSAIYEDLLCFSSPLENEEVSDTANNTRSKRPTLVRQSSVCFSPKKGMPCPEKELRRDPHTGKAMQERNDYAMSVWRRVRTKLEGRDPDSARRSTVSEQVDFIINEATNLDNLALLYEGWTPWV
ncbi:serine/threonine-protein kinase SMG1 [Thrips palmi]|uniref:non-specific serine/threonine protein kinase n=1 Tax=Thrips palmi TaxID=161013 RepID=A0A6P8ZYP1_THRPL|nr:serine/threonine-protein kinase SMG1 [Thrips palmi]